MSTPSTTPSGSTAGAAPSTVPSTAPMERVDPETGLRVDAQGRRLCSANRSNGQGKCRAPAVGGQRVCRTHGGSSPQAKRKAQLRLAELVNPAIATLAREMANADKSADKQRAANSILDRAGIPRSVTSPDGEAARDLLLERLYQIRAERGIDMPDPVTAEQVETALDDVMDDVEEQG